MTTKPVRVQWDPERDVHHQPLPHRSIQVGLRGEAIEKYVHEWVIGIEDITSTVHKLADRLRQGDIDGAVQQLPTERPYLLPSDIAAVVGSD